MFIVKKNTRIIIATLAIAISGIAAILGWTYLAQKTSAADMSKFDPGNIMSDAVMSNKDSMSVQQIQAFLNSKNACNNTNTYMASWYPHLQYTIRDGKFVCMAQDTFNGKSAAQIIWQVGQDYNINPQFLIVLLEKEQGLVTDTWPNHVQYRSATGFGCPDTAACDSKYFGLENQLRNAANLFRTVLNGGWSNYPVGWTYVQYNPNASCGGKVINIQNRATSALYRYTPYQPNQSAINAGYGVGDSCGAYGNRNTWALFTDWFGDTSSGVNIDIIKATNDISVLVLNKRSDIGEPAGPAVPEYNKSPRVWQYYEKGLVIWTSWYGAAFIPYNTTFSRWQELGGSNGSLGVPKSSANTELVDGRTWQNFDKGQLIYAPETGGWEIMPGDISNKWSSLGGSLGVLKKPISSITVNSGVEQQQFEGGTIVHDINKNQTYAMVGKFYNTWSKASSLIGFPKNDTVIESSGHSWQSFDRGILIQDGAGTAWPVLYNGFHTKWQSMGGSRGQLGRPTSNQNTEPDGRIWQFFEKGLVVKKSVNATPHEILYGSIYNRWQETGGSNGTIGVPIGSSYKELDGRTWQYFERGVIIHSEYTGSWEVEGNFYGFWKENGGSNGTLGKPTSSKIISSENIRSQHFENGTIIWSPQNGWSIRK